MKIFQWFPFGKVARNTYLIFAAPLYLLPISLLLMSFTLWLQIDTEFLNTLINYGGILAQGFLLLATPGRLRDIGCNLLTGILLFCLMATGLGLEILDVVSPLPDWTALLWLVSTGAFYFCLAPAAGEERTYFYTPLLRFRDFVGTSSPAEFFMWHMFLLDVSLYLIVCVFVLNLLPVAVFYIAAGILVLPTLSLTIRRVRDCGEGRFLLGCDESDSFEDSTHSGDSQHRQEHPRGQKITDGNFDLGQQRWKATTATTSRCTQRPASHLISRLHYAQTTQPTTSTLAERIERRIDCRREDRRNRYARATHFVPERLPEATQVGLRGGIVRNGREGSPRCNRRHQNDMPATALAHYGREQSAEFGRRGAVQSDDCLNTRRIGALQLIEDQHSRIIDKSIDLDCVLLTIFEYLLGSRRLGQIDTQRLGLNPELRPNTRCHTSVLVVAVAHHNDIATLGSQLTHILLANARRATRNQRKTSHR